MKAAITNAYGSPSVLELGEIATPTIGDEDVLIQVHASPVTEGDRRLRASDFPGMSWLPGRLMFGLIRPKHRVPGTQFAGRVVAVGKDVTHFAKGDDVFGGAMHSAQAEYLSIPEDGTLAHMPTGLDYAEAAAVPYGAVTALIFLRDLAKIQPGDRVLIMGASGGVGRFAVQLAKHLGAEVTGAASTDHALVRSLGADHVINYKTEDFSKHIERYDVIFDTSGALHYSVAKAALTQTGRFLSLIVSMGLLLQVMLTSVFGKGRRALFGVAFGEQSHFEEVRDLVEAGVIYPVLDRRYPLAQIRAAHTHLETVHPHGTVVVTLACPA